jgi:hypothetical protein
MGMWMWGRVQWTLSIPSFGSHLNPILTRGADYAHHKLMSQPSFESQRRASVMFAHAGFEKLTSN